MSSSSSLSSFYLFTIILRDLDFQFYHFQCFSLMTIKVVLNEDCFFFFFSLRSKQEEENILLGL